MTSATRQSTTAAAYPALRLAEGDRNLGARLRELRQQHGLTLRSLAQKVGVTATALHAWESGRRNPRAANLRAFADAFKLSESELLFGVDEKEHWASARGADLADEIEACKRRIAAAAGTSVDRIRVVIEV